MKRKIRERTLARPLLLVIVLAVLEPALIILGVLSKVFSYSPGNILFLLARLIIVAYLAYSRADEGWKKSALNGAVLGFASYSIICASGLVGGVYFETPVLGISADTKLGMLLLLVAVIIGSTILLSLFAALVTLLTRKFKPPKRPSPR